LLNLKSAYKTFLPTPVRRKIRVVRNVFGGKEYKVEPLREHFDLYRSKGLLFVHIPKAAGVSVFQALYGIDSWGHAPLSAFIDAFGEKEVYSVPRACIVRNPYLRLYSGYKYLRQGGRGKGLDTKRQELISPYETFEKFVKDYLSSGGALKITHFKPQNYWVSDPRGRVAMDYIGKFEEVEKSVKDMSKIFGINVAPLPKLNQAPTQKDANQKDRDVMSCFDQEMIEITNHTYREDFDLFGYTPIKL
jgi:hypothetical protein